MKNIIKTITILFICLIPYTNLNAQGDSTNVEYPKYTLNENGEIVEVIFTYSQAQMIDNKLEILENYELLLSKYKSNDTITIALINEQSNKIEHQQEIIFEQTEQLERKETLIKNLNETIDSYEEELNMEQGKNESYENEIEHLKDEVEKEKTRKVIAYIASGIVIIAVLVLNAL